MNEHITLFLQSIFGRTSENYGHDIILKSYIGYPKWLPLNAQIQHGWYGSDIPDLKKEGKIQVFLAWSRRISDSWKQKSRKDSFVLGAPFVLYREMNQITQSPNAIGTVVFPDHSTPSNTEEYSVEEYCSKLNKLPKKMHPITVCLHFRDYESKKEEFQNFGFKVVTAGDSRQKENGFVRRFYEVLSGCRYTCSSVIGSFTFYSVEMGIPFFIYGPDSVTVSKSDNTVIEKNELRKKIKDSFKEIIDKPTPEQTALVKAELGVMDRVDSKNLKQYFIKRFFLRELPLYPFRLISTLIAYILKIAKNR